MVTEAHRLRCAYEANHEFGGTLPAGATAAELEDLRAALLPRHLPEEYIDLLSVLNGTGPESIMLADIGALLSCDQVVSETERRSDRGGLPWCPAWSVISSEGWTFAALFTGGAPIATSPVVDLTYGNQDLPIAAAPLTAIGQRQCRCVGTWLARRLAGRPDLVARGVRAPHPSRRPALSGSGSPGSGGRGEHGRSRLAGLVATRAGRNEVDARPRHPGHTRCGSRRPVLRPGERPAGADPRGD